MSNNIVLKHRKQKLLETQEKYKYNSSGRLTYFPLVFNESGKQKLKVHNIKINKVKSIHIDWILFPSENIPSFPVSWEYLLK